MSLTDVQNARWLHDHLLTSGQPTAKELAEAAESGMEVVINLTPGDAKSALPDERTLVERLGMTYIHVPVSFDSPSLASLTAFFDAIATFASRSVWVHCGTNRIASVFLGLYAVLREGTDLDEAVQLMRAAGEPNSVWKAFIYRALWTLPSQ